MRISKINSTSTQNTHKNYNHKTINSIKATKNDSISFTSLDENNRKQQPKWTYAALGALMLSLMTGVQMDKNNKNTSEQMSNIAIENTQKDIKEEAPKYEDIIDSLLDKEDTIAEDFTDIETEYSKEELGTLKRSKAIKLQADKDYKEFIDKIWENFPKMYTATKDWSAHKKIGDDGNFYYVPAEGFAEWYDNYNNIIKISSGEKIWNSAKTANDAVRLIRETIYEARKNFADDIENRAGANATGGGDINTGEYIAIKELLDGLSSINDKTKYISDVYKEELESAREKTKKEIQTENCLIPAFNPEDMQIKNATSIEKSYKKMQASKKAISELMKAYKTTQNKETLSEIIDNCHNFSNTYFDILRMTNRFPSPENDTREIHSYIADDAILNAEFRLLTENNDIQIEAPYIFYSN